MHTACERGQEARAGMVGEGRGMVGAERESLCMNKWLGIRIGQCELG